MTAAADSPVASPVVVIGAGQAGLSVAYHLRRRGLVTGTDVTVLDRGPSTGGAWQHRWEALRLGDAHRVHDLPGMDEVGISFATAPRDRPARDVVAEYYRRYERHFEIAVRRPVDVDAVTRQHDGRFLVESRDLGKPLAASAVVGAVGTWGAPRRPEIPGTEVFRGLQVTTADYRSAADFAGLRVAVVGGGTSAIGFVREVADAGATPLWYTRGPVRFLESAATLGEDLGRESVRLQDEAARAGAELPSIVSTTGIPLTPRMRRLRDRGLLERRPMFVRLVTDGVVEQDGRTTTVDAIIWAMGFRADLAPFAGVGVDARSGVEVDRGYAVRVPGLFLAGYGPQASTVSANRGARRIARDVEAYLSDGRWPPTQPRRVGASDSITRG
ncbi:FAD-dependent oxidoreductase [Demequina muriae]|uniref:FAD-dependent oxidoreductase n=1 Tax=Demequina muriae TaxID=3051664 RepID=A0ABT8GK43_9MICO|nr:FAD-dependent oxidoreductase [Demequina sp. EGI L300058]MDN4481813.1 FAD-dependent oxidoreductase [Demequina sp. EGI L300058]